tara:strand:- start:5719 stop:7539 length:1821 start_codon:yes stop_codon:yes gene_type:complete
MNPSDNSSVAVRSPPRRSARERRETSNWQPENFNTRREQKEKSIQEHKLKRNRDKEAYELKIYLDDTDVVNQIFGTRENIKHHNLGFPLQFESHLHETDPELVAIQNYQAQLDFELARAKAQGQIPSWQKQDLQEQEFRRMVRNQLLPKYEYTEFIRRKYFIPTIYFSFDEPMPINDDSLKLKLINEAIGNQGAFIKFFFSKNFAKTWQEMFGRINQDFNPVLGPDVQRNILFHNKISFIIAITFASINRLRIKNKGKYIPIRFLHHETTNYLMMFGAFSLLYFNKVDLTKIKSTDILAQLFQLFTESFKILSEQIVQLNFISKDFVEQHMERINSWMFDVFANALLDSFQTSKDVIINLNFDDLLGLRYVLNTVAENVGHAILILNKQGILMQDSSADIDDSEAGQMMLDRTPIAFPSRDMVDNTKDDKDNSLRNGHIPSGPMASSFGWRGNIQHAVMAKTNKQPAPSYHFAPYKKDKKDKKDKKKGGSKRIKELKKLINKKQKESYKNFKLINKLEIKLKNIVEKLLELDKKYKEVQKKYKKTKNKKNKVMIDTVLKKIKKEKENKIKLRKDISKNKKESKIILKELKKLDKIIKKNDTFAKKK